MMAFGIQERKLFIVECKRCQRDIPAGVNQFPFQSIVVTCPLCGEQRRYLPSEVLLGRPNHLVAKQARKQVV
jgi:RNase P subunit RPR2